MTTTIPLDSYAVRGWVRNERGSCNSIDALLKRFQEANGYLDDITVIQIRSEWEKPSGPNTTDDKGLAVNEDPFWQRVAASLPPIPKTPELRAVYNSMARPISVKEWERLAEAEADTDAAAAPFEAIHVDDFNDLELPEALWHITDVMPVQGLGLLAAVNKSGKSLFEIQLGLCLAAGISWWGRPASQPLTVLYIEEEGAVKAIQRRTRLIKQHLGIRDRVNFYVVPRRKARIDTPEGVAALRAMIAGNESRPKADVTFIGPFSAVARVDDENAASNIGPILSDLNDMATDLKTFICVVHHAKKSGTSGAMRRPANVLSFFPLVRGSGAFIDRIDMGIGLWRSPKENAGTAYFLTRDGQDWMTNFAFDPDTLTTEPTLVESREERHESEEDALIRHIIEMEGATATDLNKHTGKSRNFLEPRLKALVAGGFLTIEAGANNRHVFRATTKGVNRVTSDYYGDDED